MTLLSDRPATLPAMDDSLTDREQELLAFAALQWRFAGARDAAIRERFDMTPTRYHQLLDQLIDRPAALAAQPVTVKRLRRLRATRLQRRGALRLTGS